MQLQNIHNAVRTPQLLEPAENAMLIAVWADTYPYLNTSSMDTPSAINARTGRNWPIFHMSQNIPTFSPTSNYPNIETRINDSVIVNTITDAGLLLDVFPMQQPGLSYSIITQDDVNALAHQCADLNKRGVKVWLRLASEMNGNWYSYAQQPVSFTNLWKQVTNAVRAVTNGTAMMWSPQILPNGQYSLNPTATGPIDSVNFKALDTNGDGQINSRDDPYTPYWPGEAFVDWIGTSIYYHGPHLAPDSSLFGINTIPPSDYFESYMRTERFPFYTFAENAGKPVSMAEWGIPYYISLTPSEPGGKPTPIDPGPGQLAMKRAWWSSSLTNKTLLNRYPLIKMFGLFEIIKEETGSLRDFQFLNRTTDSGTILSTFLADIASAEAAGVKYVFASSTRPATAPSASTTAGATPNQSAASEGCSVKRPFRFYRIRGNGDSGNPRMANGNVWTTLFNYLPALVLLSQLLHCF
ncbi:hypothetical protein SeMB42_g03833 [Synchytrium endobioticum]|uniref:GH26 domain-containing protein n=1 Tax=Synchytrium endobioticum TaxID=286115 RepID=A0A507CP39_9FUNG|nr:hypothetical protein SeLEV6574_g06367 [Synchytrium endobioticum]TPX46016.1 hypothetical protein SeMB42_g03833 [Synchytrium endobioticum]